MIGVFPSTLKATESARADFFRGEGPHAAPFKTHRRLHRHLMWASRSTQYLVETSQTRQSDFHKSNDERACQTRTTQRNVVETAHLFRLFLSRARKNRREKEKNNCGEAKSKWKNNFFTGINEIIKGNNGGSRPSDKGGWGGVSKNFFSALRASVWSKNKARGRLPEPLPWICHWGENSLSLSPLFFSHFLLFSQKRLILAQATNTHL